VGDDTGFVPRPFVVRLGTGTLARPAILRVRSGLAWAPTLDAFAAWLHAATDIEVCFVDDGPTDLAVVEVTTMESESYCLVVDETGISIRAKSSRGLANGLSTLAQLLAKSTNNGAVLGHLTIDDSPRFSWRGVHLDIARHFFGPNEITRLIDLMWLHRLNTLHLHLNDDQGWRLEIPRWPRLAEVASRRDSSPLGHVTEEVDNGIAHGGLLTLDDARDLVAYALARGVDIVPEIDLPGHAQAVIAAYPELGSGESAQVWTRWGISERVLNVDEPALRFAEEVLETVMSVFPGPFVHIGGDECPTIEWERDERAARVMAERGFTSARQLQGLFTDREATALRAGGRRAVAWDEVLDASVPSDVVIAAWRHVSLGRRAAEAGYDVMMAAMEHLYFDWPNAEDPNEPLALLPSPFATPWEKVYAFNVMPPGLDPALAHHILGAQAQLWTEYIATVEHLDYMAFPRLCAFSEVAWGTSGDADEFRHRLEQHVQLLDLIGVNYRRLD